MVNWKEIDTVFLDMDGTLLDLRFDNHFWKEFVPLKFAEKEGLSVEHAKAQLIPRFKSKEGTLDWYCLDYWSDNLQLDIAGLKAELAELIAILPHVNEFLEKIKQSSQRVLLVTNAHRDSLELKMKKTGLQPFFDGLVSSHDFGLPKEHADFWHRLQRQHPFEKQTTLLIDDSFSVLNSARQYGIAHLVSVSRPDSGLPKREIEDFPAIEDFRELMQGL
ncbi:GMP/IMP nucleotidase [Methyloglobulus sp.]|uniref:GMP/IMP nucleotidase n=1 Tax=Methyloglobulus sp. TaxID=2518622 RepID=UPI0017C6AA62|nr:GMP/IMP nucleotidase [Methyloglobulus sp.]